MKPALATKGHSAGQGGLRGHSIGATYPWAVIGRGLDAWQVVNYLSGEQGPTFTGKRACAVAHSTAELYKELDS